LERTPKKINSNSNRSDIEKDLYRLYLKEVIAIPMLTREEELKLAYQSQKGDTEALRKLVESNLRFVVKIARNFQRPGISILDLINEGNIGLIEGVRRFDPDKNVRLLSYAVWWIKQAIHYYITHQGRMIPLGSKITSVYASSEIYQKVKIRRS
jgi:RNA polymerase primary sigma factor